MATPQQQKTCANFSMEQVNQLIKDTKYNFDAAVKYGLVSPEEFKLVSSQYSITDAKDLTYSLMIAGKKLRERSDSINVQDAAHQRKMESPLVKAHVLSNDQQYNFRFATTLETIRLKPIQSRVKEVEYFLKNSPTARFGPE